MKLSDLMDWPDLELELQNGYVRERHHPADRALTILNYTEKAQYENRWTDVTRQCRGLIVDFPTGEVLARPFDHVLFTLDDRQRVVDMWRSKGLTCLQVDAWDEAG